MCREISEKDGGTTCAVMKTIHTRIAPISLTVLWGMCLFFAQSTAQAQDPAASEKLTPTASPASAASGTSADDELLQELKSMRARITELEVRIKNQAPSLAVHEAPSSAQTSTTGANLTATTGSPVVQPSTERVAPAP